MTIDTETKARAYVQGFVDQDSFSRLAQLVELLRVENSRQNLVSAGSLESVWLRHIADSIQLLSHTGQARASSWLDLGTGAGFPGLAIAATRTDFEVTLVESRRLRCEWLEFAARELGLSNLTVLHQRVEAINSRKYDVISARAFAPLEKLLKLSARFSTSRTCWVLPKGRSAAHELAQLPRPIAEMFHVEQSLTDHDAGIIVGTGCPEEMR